MKLLLHFSLVLLVMTSGCQLLPKKKFDLAKYIPPNGVKIGLDTYLDETEIANIHWLEFLYFAKQDSISGEDYLLLAPDTSVWERVPYDTVFGLDTNCRITKMTIKPDYEYFENYEVYGVHYLRYPGNRYYPVIGISQEQAILYSIWRSDVVNQHYTKILTKENKPYRIDNQFRLPQASELDYALAQNPIGPNTWQKWSNTCQPYRQAFSPQKHFNSNVLYGGILRDTFMISPSSPFFYSVYSTKNGSFHALIGNAAELTAEPFTSWGGSCFDVVEREQFHNRMPHFKPDYKTGFRCVCQVSVVAASTWKPEKWYQKPEVKELFNILRAQQVIKDSIEGRWTDAMVRRAFARNLPSCPNYQGRIQVGKRNVKLGEEIVFADTLTPIYLPGYQGTTEVMVLNGRFPSTSYNASKERPIRISPDVLKYGDAILIVLRSNGSACERIYLPYRFEERKKNK